MKMSRYLARALVNANLMSARDYAQRYWWSSEPKHEEIAGNSRPEAPGMQMRTDQHRTASVSRSAT
jgi:hypothetical protein